MINSGINFVVAKKMRGCIVLFAHSWCSPPCATFSFGSNGKNNFKGRQYFNIFTSEQSSRISFWWEEERTSESCWLVKNSKSCTLILAYIYILFRKEMRVVPQSMHARKKYGASTVLLAISLQKNKYFFTLLEKNGHTIFLWRRRPNIYLSLYLCMMSKIG